MRPQAGDDVDIDEDDDELTREIQEQVDEWSSNSNECLTVQLLRGDGTVSAAFHPEFTNAFFGIEESIFGYQNLDITLSFRASDMKPRLHVKYGKSFPAQGDIKPTDINETLAEFLPDFAFNGKPLVDNVDFKPPGEKIHEYKRGGKVYETWVASLAEKSARRMLQNMQILVPMFIDGGSMLELEQNWTTARWKIFLVYEVDPSPPEKASPYTLAGYSTSYRSFTFPERQKSVKWGDVFSPNSQSLLEFLPQPDGETNVLSQEADFASPLELPARERLSQFLMFPPWHGSGHGQELYNTMYKYLAGFPNVREFTVEDPNEKFDELRDFCDLIYLRANVPEFNQLRIHTEIPPDRLHPDSIIPTNLIVPSKIREQIMRETKIMPRQFDRLVEMHTLSFIPPGNRSKKRLTQKHKASNENDRAYYFWRLYVKQRLYIFNRDQLVQIERHERFEKLESALDSVLEEYSERLEKVEAREQQLRIGDLEEDTAVNPSAAKRKRKVVGDEEDEEDGDEKGGAEKDEAQAGEANGHKKIRVG